MEFLAVGMKMTTPSGKTGVVIGWRAVAPIVDPVIIILNLSGEKKGPPMLTLGGTPTEEICEHVRGEIPEWALSGEAILHGEATVPEGYDFYSVEGDGRMGSLTVVWRLEDPKQSHP